MNYEELYSEMQNIEKDTKDSLGNQQRTFKKLCKYIDNGNLKGFIKDIALLESQCEEYKKLIADMREQVEKFDTREYFTSGEFAEQMVRICKTAGVDVKGEFGSYEMFPHKVKIDNDSLDISVDRKKVQTFRPSWFVNEIKVSQEKLNKANFRALEFANELANVYDLALLKSKRSPGTDFSLMNLYKFLTPMKSFKRDYNTQAFAFDLARLYSSGVDTIDDGRALQFGPSHDIRKSIRILDKDGHEQYFATIRFY